MLSEKAKRLSCADTAKLVRETLKDAYPSIKFSVTSKTYSMGASINVRWTDGPTTKEVNALVGQFAGSHGEDNGGDTIKAYHDSRHPTTGELVHYGADHVFSSRSYSVDFTRKIASIVATKYGKPMPVVTASKYDADHADWTTADYETQRFMQDELYNTSALTPKPAEKRVKGVLTFDQTTEDGQTVYYIGGDTWPNQRTIRECGGKWVKDVKKYRLVADELPAALVALTKPADEVKQIDATQRAARFNELADGMQPAIDEKRRPRNWNPTNRRNRMDESRTNEARHLELVQDKLRALATAWEAGSVPEILQGVTNRAQVDYLVAYKTMPPADSKWEETQRDYKRLVSAGIRTEADYLAACAALNALGSQTIGKKTAADELREVERDIALKPIPGYFPTPADLVDEMISRADIQPYNAVLEPSAGAGHIADPIRARFPDSALDVVEVNSTLVSLLRKKGYAPIADDFLTIGGAYDRILMNPPFEQLQDVDHVRHAYDLLRPGGRLVAIMSESPFFRQDKKAEAFRDWLDSVGGTSDRNAPDAFKASDRPTGVQTRLVVIDKPQPRATKPQRDTVARIARYIETL